MLERFSHPIVLPLLIFAFAADALIIAFVAEYGFDLKPCILCLYQRIPYYIMLALGLLAVVLFRKPQAVKTLTYVSIIVLLVGAGIAGFHVGVEEKWWQGTEDCVGASGAASIEELRAQLLTAPIVRCDEVAFRLFGLSMTAWNLLYAIGISFVLGFLLKIRKN